MLVACSFALVPPTAHNENSPKLNFALTEFYEVRELGVLESSQQQVMAKQH